MQTIDYQRQYQKARADYLDGLRAQAEYERTLPIKRQDMFRSFLDAYNALVDLGWTYNLAGGPGKLNRATLEPKSCALVLYLRDNARTEYGVTPDLSVYRVEESIYRAWYPVDERPGTVGGLIDLLYRDLAKIQVEPEERTD